MHRVISPRGAKPCLVLKYCNLLLTFFGSRHCTCAYIRWLKEEGWKYFCRFVFACFPFNTNPMIKLKFNDLTAKTKQNKIH